MKNENEFQFGHYFVAYMDVLGQKELLRNLTFPENEEEKVISINNLKSTAGVILEFRDMIEKTFESFTRPTPDLEYYPKDIQDKIFNFTKPEINYRSFSDSIIINISLANDNEHCTPMNGIFLCLITLCSTYLVMLAKGHPVRGGVDIGPCLSLYNNEVYGSALERAYCLESKIANYPRIVIGAELFKYLKGIQNQNVISNHGKHAKCLAERSLNLIRKENDGVLTLDYLCNEIIEISKDSNEDIPLRNLFEMAKKFVDRSICKFQGVDNKLYERYCKVMNYLKTKNNLNF
jgi:hypothetical protein